MVNLYSRDLARTYASYLSVDFVEASRTPKNGDPVHIEMALDGFKLGLATFEAARDDHGLQVGSEGRWIDIVLWTDDVDAALRLLVDQGARALAPTHDFQDGKLRSGWITSPEGDPVQLVQQKAAPIVEEQI